jgi:glycosyltransferase involved in cell wall biosynthesis
MSTANTTSSFESSVSAAPQSPGHVVPGPEPSGESALSFRPGSGLDSHWTRSPAAKTPIVVICHLGWDWVWQRPQQFMSRFARTHRVLFVETHTSDTTTTHVRVHQPPAHPNITVAQIHLPASRSTDMVFTDRERRVALQRLLNTELNGEFSNCILWFYDPMAVNAYAGRMGESVIVYDCMDELSQFKGAPRGLAAREQTLLGMADVVFCGGKKMREKRLPLNPNCHFYGTGVDGAHFGAALSNELPVAPEIAALQKPVLGYFGVVDERIDYELLSKLAAARDDWSVAIVGPSAKVDPAMFPKHPNLHFLGGRSYHDLPAITKGFAVCLMPFALNEATEFINPTKALEYMAAGKPVVSTALNEVRTNFKNVARIAETHERFIQMCSEEIEMPSRMRIARGLQLAQRNSWERIVAEMEKHVAAAMDARRSASASATTPASALNPAAALQ